MTSTVRTPASSCGTSRPREVLAAVAARRRVADRAEAELLALAVHWVDLHPSPSRRVVPRRVLGEQSRRAPGRDAGIAVAIETLAPALGTVATARRSGWCPRRSSCASGCPRLWYLVQDGRLQAWKARQVAARDHLALTRGGRVRGPAPRGHRPPRTAPSPRRS